MRTLTMVLVLLTMALPATPATPARDVLPVTITNRSGLDAPMYLYVLVVDLGSDRLGYVQDGAFVPWDLPASDEPQPAPDVAIAGPADGEAMTVEIPVGMSGRIYVAYGDKLAFSLVRDGLVQPAPWNVDDPTTDVLFDWSEFTYNAHGVWLNSSQVDQFALPQEVAVTGADGSVATAGAMAPGGRDAVIDAISATPGFERTVMRRADGTVLRVLSPGKATAVGLMDANYLDDEIADAWRAFVDEPLVVVPFAHEPETVFTGRTEGDQLVFTDASGREVARFDRPTTLDVWECAGALDAPNDHVVGPIARTLCAALHRGTLGDSAQEPVTDPGLFYQRPVTNHYALIIHGEMRDGRAYAFAFDDVAAQESLVHTADPIAAGIVVQPLGAVSRSRT